MNKFKLYLSLLILTVNLLAAQKKYNRIALLNGIAHIGNGEVIEGSLIVINKDRIETVMSSKGV